MYRIPLRILTKNLTEATLWWGDDHWTPSNDLSCAITHLKYPQNI